MSALLCTTCTSLGHNIWGVASTTYSLHDAQLKNKHPAAAPAAYVHACVVKQHNASCSGSHYSVRSPSQNTPRVGTADTAHACTCAPSTRTTLTAGRTPKTKDNLELIKPSTCLCYCANTCCRCCCCFSFHLGCHPRSAARREQCSHEAQAKAEKEHDLIYAPSFDIRHTMPRASRVTSGPFYSTNCTPAVRRRSGYQPPCGTSAGWLNAGASCDLNIRRHLCA
jgi:hypothetical protein